MAIQNVKRDLTSILNSIDHEFIRKQSGATDFHVINITALETAVALQKGTQRMLLQAGFNRQEVRKLNQEVNTKASWQAVIGDIFGQFRQGPKVIINGVPCIQIQKIQGTTKNVQGAYLARNSNTKVMRVILLNQGTGSNRKIKDITLKGFLGAFRILAWRLWVDRLPPFYKQVTDNNLKETGYSHSFGIRTPFVHESGSAVGTGLLKDFRDSLDDRNTTPELELLGLPTAYYDIVEMVKQASQIDWSETQVTMPDGSTKISRVITGGIGGLNYPGSAAGDVSRVKKDLEKALKVLLEKNARRFGFDAESGLDYETSKSARRRITENAIARTLQRAKKSKTGRVKVKVKGKAKPLKSGTRKASVSRSRKTQPKSAGRVGILLTAQATASRKQSGKKNEVAMSMAKLRATINRRLPAQVRRNMGRPALENRTGRFSNSVELQSLRAAKNTLVGEYTYQLDPYQTFENTGQRRWPNGYNPKPLIARSIRELAGEYVENKFTLRRV